MPRHVAIDANLVSGSLRFENTKTAAAAYQDSKGNPVLFARAPRIKLTPLSAGVQNPHKVANTKSGNLFSGFIVGFGSVVTGDIEWEATERG